MSLKWMLLLLALIVGALAIASALLRSKRSCPMEHGLTSRRSP